MENAVVRFQPHLTLFRPLKKRKESSREGSFFTTSIRRNVPRLVGHFSIWDNRATPGFRMKTYDKTQDKRLTIVLLQMKLFYPSISAMILSISSRSTCSLATISLISAFSLTISIFSLVSLASTYVETDRL